MTDIPSTGEDCDLAIVGAGLAGGLIALALAARRPDLRVLLLDNASCAGGNHIWSFFDSDVGEDARMLLAPLVTHRWDAGHDVHFPSGSRHLSIPYNSIASNRMDVHLRDVLGERLILDAPVVALTPTQIRFSDDRVIDARAVIDARGFISNFATNRGTSADEVHSGGCDPTAYPPRGRYSVACPAPSGAGHFLFGASGICCGWQKFVGQRLRLDSPHGLDRPVIMDATVDQIDGYRFLYLLPQGRETLFVEDTRYADAPDLDVPAIRDRIAAYAFTRGWTVNAVEYEERGALPVVKSGDFDQFWPPNDPVARAGVRAGLFHPTTGYSLPAAAGFALWLAGHADLPGAELAKATRARAARHWRDMAFYRMLGRMMFDAAPPGQRIRIFERFYGLPGPLIARFYAGRCTFADKIRILCGRPPVRITAAMRAMMKSSAA